MDKKLWNVYFSLRGPAGEVKDVPNNTNPIACVNMESLLVKLSTSLPTRCFGVDFECIGIRIEEFQE